MCRPVGVFWAEAFPGGHIGPPLRGGEKFPQPTRPSCVEASATGRDGARPLQGEREWTGGGVRSPRPTEAAQVVPSVGADVGIGPYALRGDERAARRGRRALRVVAESRRDCPGQRRTAKRLRRGWEELGGIRAEIIPKGGINAGQSLSQPAADSSLCTREPLGTGVRAAVPKAWPPPTKFRNEIWGVGQVVGPYGRSTEVPATGRCGHRPLRKEEKATSITRASGAQRSVCGADGRSGWESEQGSSQKGDRPPRPPGQRLAKRKARKEQLVKFGLCPIPSKCSTAYRVRKSQQSPARAPAGAASTEQNGLGPHPAAREGAPRP